MPRKSPRRLPPVEDEIIQLVDTKAIKDQALVEALRGISNPAVYNNPRVCDTVIFLAWNKMVSGLCRILRKGDMRRWEIFSRSTKERYIESLFPGISFRKFENAIMDMLGELIHARSRKQKRPQT